jgi:hypothetical protein
MAGIMDTPNMKPKIASNIPWGYKVLPNRMPKEIIAMRMSSSIADTPLLNVTMAGIGRSTATGNVT